MSAAEMRRAVEHSTDLLRVALDAEHKQSYPKTRTIAALAHAIGMQRLLVTYLHTGEDGFGDDDDDEELALHWLRQVAGWDPESAANPGAVLSQAALRCDQEQWDRVGRARALLEEGGLLDA